MLIRSISGIRGLVNEDLKENAIINYANALNDYLPEGVIYAGRDSRPSGEEIAQLMIDELIRLGRTIIYCGIVPTPTVQYMVHISEAVGGFIITASHNPIEWNGIKFLREDSTFFHKKDCEKLLQDTFSQSTTPFVFLSAGMKFNNFYNSLCLAKSSNINFLGFLCGRSLWYDSINIFANSNQELFIDWIQTEGIRRINKLKSAI